MATVPAMGAPKNGKASPSDPKFNPTAASSLSPKPLIANKPVLRDIPSASPYREPGYFIS